MTTTNTEPTSRVIVGVDGSPESEQALRWAGHFAELSGARLLVVTAWDYPATSGWRPGHRIGTRPRFRAPR